MSSFEPVSARTVALFSLSEIDRQNKLLADYLLNNPRATDLFAHSPEEMPVLAGKVRAQADRAQLSAALTSFQQHIGADHAGIAAARLLKDPATPVITVGQQPGLLTGPLYTIFKAMTAINTAHRLAERVGRPVVPVFWVGSDDDDRGEADHCEFWDQQYGSHHIRYPEQGGYQGQIIGNLPAGVFGEQVLEQVIPLTKGLPFAGEMQQLLQETLAASADMGEWFCRLMARLFSGQGLVMCDPRLPEIRRLSSEVLKREITDSLKTTEAVNHRARELRKVGYRPQLTKPSDNCNIFLIDGVRSNVTYSEGLFHAAGQSYTQQEILELIEHQPERWAPNAVLRPVVQEFLLGSSLFIAGPSELGYWAELNPVFQAVKVEMPPVMPRGAMTLMPPGIARLLEQWHFNPLDFLNDFDTLRFDLLATQQPQPVAQDFAKARKDVERVIARLSQTISVVDSSLSQSALSTHQRMLNEVERLERKTLKAVERKSAAQTAQLERVRNALFPGHGQQERALNIFCLLARYGPDLLKQLGDLLDGEEGRHLFVEL